MGVGVGLLYDLFRVMRVRIPLPLMGSVLDLLFWLVVTVGLFVYATAAGNGEVRFYVIAAVMLGAVAYFLSVSRWVLKGAYAAADLISIICKIVTFPLLLLARLGKKLSKTAKKSFHYQLKWYKIRLLSREMDEIHRQAGEGAVNESQKSVSFNKDRGSGSAHRRRHRTAEPAGKNRRGSE